MMVEVPNKAISGVCMRTFKRGLRNTCASVCIFLWELKGFARTQQWEIRFKRGEKSKKFHLISLSVF